MHHTRKGIPRLCVQSQLPGSGRPHDNSVILMRMPAEEWGKKRCRSLAIPGPRRHDFGSGPVADSNIGNQPGLTDMAPHEDAPQTRNVVQAQPNLEVWPFVAMVQTSYTPTVLTNPHQPDNPIIFA